MCLSEELKLRLCRLLSTQYKTTWLVGNASVKGLSESGAPGILFRGPVADVVRFQTLANLHKDHFDVTGQFLVYYNRIRRQISSTSRHR